MPPLSKVGAGIDECVGSPGSIILRNIAINESLIRLIESLGHPRILVVGDLMLDRYVWGTRAGAARGQYRGSTGRAAGVAGILRSLESNVSLAGVVGDDVDGRRCRNLLVQFGIDSVLVMTDAARPTTMKGRYIGRAEQKHPQQSCVDHETDAPISADLAASLADQVIQKLKQVFVTTSIHL